MTDEWKVLGPADKQRYEEESNRLKVQFQKDMNEYKKKKGDDKDQDK